MHADQTLQIIDFRPSEGRVQPPSLPSVLWWLGKFCEFRVLERGPIRVQIETDLSHTSEPIALILEMSFERVDPAQGLKVIIAANQVKGKFLLGIQPSPDLNSHYRTVVDVTKYRGEQAMSKVVLFLLGMLGEAFSLGSSC